MNNRFAQYLANHRWPTITARLLVAVVFLFSAVVKTLDPYGTVLKLEEYFAAAGVEWLDEGSAFMAVALVTIESLLGAALLVGAWPRTMARLAVVVCSLFALLTLWVVIANPVADCGCFGDLIVLSNGATFAKNLLLLALSIVLLLGVRQRRTKLLVAVVPLVVGAAVATLASYALIDQPFVDRFPFKTGTNLREEMNKVYQEKLQSSYVICRNLHDGRTARFGADDPTWWDESEWEFVEMESPEEEPTIEVKMSDFAITAGGLDITAQLLEMPMCRLCIVEDVSRLSEEELAKMRALTMTFIRRVERTVVVTASSLKAASLKFPGVEVANMDAVTMRALLRAPAGVVTLERGVIRQKLGLGVIKNPS